MNDSKKNRPLAPRLVGAGAAKARPTKVEPLAITTLPPAPVDERRGRMIKYSVSMLIRLVCIIVAFTVPFGWWTAIPAIGAIVLPYIAVVLANVGAEGPRSEVERPGGLEVYRPEANAPGYDAPPTGDDRP